MANQPDYTFQEDISSMQIEVKKVTDTIVVCNLIVGGTLSEILLKRGDYDSLVERGFFHLTSLLRQPMATVIASSDKYAANSPHLVG
jgi:hypothetical protein